MTTIAVVHTGLVSVQPIKEQISELIPDAWVIIVDDSLLNDVLAAGHVTPEVASRIHSYMANAQAMRVEVTERIAEGAFEALLSGDGARHDEIVKSAISTLAEQVDVIVLAQVSMARLVPQLEGVRVPVLSSPRSGVAALKRALDNLPKVSAPNRNR